MKQNLSAKTCLSDATPFPDYFLWPLHNKGTSTSKPDTVLPSTLCIAMAIVGARESWDAGGLTFDQPSVGATGDAEVSCCCSVRLWLVVVVALPLLFFLLVFFLRLPLFFCGYCCACWCLDTINLCVLSINAIPGKTNSTNRPFA